MAKKSQNKEEVTETKGTEVTKGAGDEAQSETQPTEKPATKQVQPQAQAQAPKVTHEKPVEIDYRTGRPVAESEAAQAKGKAAPAQEPEKAAKEGHEQKVFTQEDVNKIISQRLERERKKLEKQIRQELASALSGETERGEPDEAAVDEPEAIAAEVRDKEVQLALAVHAARKGLDPEIAIRLADLGKAEWDEAGHLTNADVLLDEVAQTLQRALPRWQVSQTPANPPAGQQEAAIKQERIKRLLYGNGVSFWEGGGSFAAKEQE